MNKAFITLNNVLHSIEFLCTFPRQKKPKNFSLHEFEQVYTGILTNLVKLMFNILKMN